MAQVVDLRSELKKLGLDFKGKKAELVARLEAAFKASTAEPTDKVASIMRAVHA